MIACVVFAVNLPPDNYRRQQTSSCIFTSILTVCALRCRSLNRKSIAAQYFSILRSLLHAQFDDVGDSRDKLSIGGFSFLGMNGVAEVAIQHFNVSPSPGHLHQMPDGPLHPGCGGVEGGCQLGIQAEGDSVYWDIYGINVLLFIGLFLL